MQRRYMLAGIVCVAMLVGAGCAVALQRNSASDAVLRAIPLPHGVALSSVGVVDGRVFVNSWSSGVLMHTASASRPWRTITLPGQPAGLLAIGHGDVIATSAVGDTIDLTMIDARRGAIVREVSLDQPPAAIAVDARGDRVVVAGSSGVSCSSTSGCSTPDGVVAMVDAASGRLLRVWRPHLQITAVGLDGRAGRIVVAAANSQINASSVSVYNSATGQLVGRLRLTRPPQHIAVDEATDRAFVLATAFPIGPAPLSPGYHVGPVLRGVGGVYVIDLRTGRLVRAITLARPANGVAIDAARGRAFVLDGGPQSIVSDSTPGGGGEAGPMPVGPGHVVMLDARSGAVLRVTQVGIMPAALALDARHGRALVVNRGSRDGLVIDDNVPSSVKAPLVAPGGVSVLDAAGGRLLHTIDLGTTPDGIAVDQQANRAYVGDAGAQFLATTPDPWGWVPSWLRRRLPFLPRRQSGQRVVTLPSRVIVLDTSRL